MIVAPADRFTASAAIAAGGGTAGLAGARSCAPRSLAGGKQKPSGQSCCINPGRATQARQSADVCVHLRLVLADTTKYNEKNTTKNKIEKTEQNPTFSEKYEGPTTNQQIDVPTITCLDP